MNYSIEIKGLDKLDKRLKDIASRLPSAIQKAMPEILDQTSKLVIFQAPENTGKLKESIKYEIVDASNGEVKGRVYADVNVAPYALWVNYGTGIYAEGEGGSRAEKIPWFVHESMADLSKYKYPMWTSPTGEKFYIVWGARATHFMDSAEFIMRTDNIRVVVDEIKKIMEG